MSVNSPKCVEKWTTNWLIAFRMKKTKGKTKKCWHSRAIAQVSVDHCIFFWSRLCSTFLWRWLPKEHAKGRQSDDCAHSNFSQHPVIVIWTQTFLSWWNEEEKAGKEENWNQEKKTWIKLRMRILSNPNDLELNVTVFFGVIRLQIVFLSKKNVEYVCAERSLN